VGISSSASIRLNKGEPYGRTLNTTGLTQGTVNLTVEPIGTFFYSTVRLLDLRFAKNIVIGGTKLEGLLDIFQRDELAGDSEREPQTGASLQQRAHDGEPADSPASASAWSF
jgi:hypothetical protein